ncbi:MAG TPA: hypothetical protein VN654_11370 [Vicinamibacterales bacterium]|nr:hypothetical protein [Vicinamibacterales bacterium]
MEALLPQRPLSRGRMSLTGTLFRALDQSSKVGAVGRSFDEQMRVIGHQAVRQDYKLPAAGCTQKLTHDRSSERDVAEWCAAIERAERYEIAVRTDVTESFDARRARHRIPMDRKPQAGS